TIPLPPAHPLFLPYTTLFRSFLADDNLIVREGVRALIDMQADLNIVGVGADYDETVNGATADRLVVVGAYPNDVQVGLHVDESAERKSTRLNSSHVGRSYAVF